MRVLWFVLLLPFVAMAAQKQNSCIGKNSFLESMSKAKPLSISIHQRPEKRRFAHCSYEWNRFGSCCDATDMEDFIRLENKLIDSNQQYLSRVVEEFAGITNQLHLFANFNEDSTYCWNYMKKVRGSALCSICSGRHREFTSRGRLLVTMNTCEETVAHCESFFLAISQVSGQLHRKIIAERKRKGRGKQAERLKHLQRDLMTFRPPKKLIQAFEHSHKKRNSKEAVRIKAELKVCSMVLNVRKRPYILVLNPEGIEEMKKSQLKRIHRRKTILRQRLYRQKRVYLHKLKRIFQMKKRLETQKHWRWMAVIRYKNKPKKAIKKDMKHEKSRFKKVMKNLTKNYYKKKRDFERVMYKKECHVDKESNSKSKSVLNTVNSELKNWGKKIKNSIFKKGRKLSIETDARSLSDFHMNFLERSKSLSKGQFSSDTTVLFHTTDTMIKDIDTVTGFIVAAPSSYLKPMNMSLQFP